MFGYDTYSIYQYTIESHMQKVSNTAIYLAALCVVTLTQTNSVCWHEQIYCVLWLTGCKQKTHKGFKASQSSLLLSFIYCWKEHTKYVNISTHYEHIPGTAGSPYCCSTWGPIWGSEPCLQAPQSWVLRVEEHWSFTPPVSTENRTHNLQVTSPTL